MKSRSARIFGAPLLVFGVVALATLAWGRRAPKSPDSLAEYLTGRGYACTLSEPYDLEGFGELCWTLRVGDRVFTLRRAPSEMQAAAEQSSFRQNSQDFPVNLYYGRFEVYRNEAYLLEVVGQGDARTAEIGASFENW